MGARNEGASFTLVQALRGIAAFWVVLFHAAAGGHLDAVRAALPHWVFVGVFEAGHYGVSIFFALSGFVIAHSLRSAVVTPGYAGRFALRRSIRLDPPYWTAIALMIGQQWVEALLKGTPAPPVSLTQIGAHLIYMQEILGYPHINSVFWTLCFEVQFYLGFVLLLMLAAMLPARVRRAAPVFMFALAMSGALGLFRSLPSGVALSLWHAFFVGVLAYWAAGQKRGATLGLIALAAVMVMRATPESLGSAISAITALSLFAAARAGQLTRLLAAKWLQWLGLISYSLYLSHNMVSGSAYWLLGRMIPGGVVGQSVNLVIVAMLCLVVAHALWWLVERPSHALAKRIGAGRPSTEGVALRRVARL